MDPNIFDNVTNDSSDDIKEYVQKTSLVANVLYEIEGGDGLKQLKENQTRMLQIDRYYIAKYKAETRVLQRFVLFCCLVLIGSIFYNKGLVTLSMFTSYVIIICIVMVYVIGLDVYNIFIKDNTNFDEIDYSIYYAPGPNNYNRTKISNLPSCPP